MITILFDYYLPAYKAGGPIQSLVNLATHLRSNKLRLACSNKDLDGTRLNVPVNTWVSESLPEVYYAKNGFWNLIKATSKSETFYINGIFSLHYNLLPAIFFSGRRIISVRGMLHPEALLQKSLKKKIYLYVWKLLKLHRRCEYHATTEQESNFIRESFGNKTKVWVIPNLPRSVVYQKLPGKKEGELNLCTVALISPMKNHLSVLQALKDCKEKITWNIYGPIKDLAYWKKCKEAISQLPENITVTYYGDVPSESVIEVMAKSHVFIQPSMSENFGHSLLEALFAGRPVITSNNLPWTSLKENSAGFNTLPTDILAIRNAVSFFCQQDNVSLKKWSDSAREYALKAIDIPKIKTKYCEMFGISEESNSINNI